MSNCFLQYKWTVIITREIKCFRINITLMAINFCCGRKDKCDETVGMTRIKSICFG